MLEPGRRQLFLDTLRPPEGYVLDRAIGTTFTLDLMTLLAVPLAFTFRDAQDRDGRLGMEPLSLLESARRYADRIVVFCHGGQTSVPRASQPALAFIEQSVIAVFPPNWKQTEAIFHPKIWVLRYRARDDTENEPIRYRLICQSRNLTFDASWDSSLVLDGELASGRVRGYSLNRPLVDFIRSLPALSPYPISNTHEESIDIIAGEIRRARFDPPEGMELSRFLSFGVSRKNPPYPDLERRPLLVISPFLDGEFLHMIESRRPRSVLVSRRETLLTTPAEAIAAFDEVYAFRPGLEPEVEDTEGFLPPLAGLHAKIYVIDDGWKARVAVGSANSTRAALGNPPRNVEFMVELVGSKSRLGIDALLAPPKQGEAGTFRSLIESFDPQEAGTVTEDEDEVNLNRLLDSAARILARCDLGGTVELSDGDRYVMRLQLDDLPDLPSGVESIACWPVTLGAAYRQSLEDGVQFEDLSLAELSAFLGIEVRARMNDRSMPKRFARGIRLSGLPEDRLPRLIASMLGDRERFIQLLWLLLSPDQEVSFSELSDLLSRKSTGADWDIGLSGLLERMLETMGADPKKLDAVASLLDDLRRTEVGREIVGPEFDAIWDVLWTVRTRRES